MVLILYVIILATYNREKVADFLLIFVKEPFNPLQHSSIIKDDYHRVDDRWY